MRARLFGWMPIALTCALLGCGQPTFIECPPGHQPCDDGCVDLMVDGENCGTCGRECPTGTCNAGQCVGAGACATNNGGCSPQAQCMDLGGGQVTCLCNPGFTGDGFTCAACTLCDSTQFVSSPCMPFADTTCATCAPACESGMFEAQACGPQDRVCELCSFCGLTQYEISPCAPTQNTQCGQCETGCNTCTGPGPTCLECQNGFFNMGGICMPLPVAFCSNGVIEPGELCDDNNTFDGDGCSSVCQIEANHYCFAQPSICNPGSCIVEPATSLPLGPAFVLDGAGSTSAGGLTFSQRSSIYTAADVNYPVFVEMDVVYSGDDTTIIGSRGTGQLDVNNSDLQAASVRARLFSSVELVTNAGNVETSTPTPFTPALGVPYRVRYLDDGFMVSVEWMNLNNPSEGVALQFPTQYHGDGDRAFVGGGALAGLTVSNLRVCEAPALPVTDLAARFSAIPSWTVIVDGLGNVTQWRDASGNNRNVNEAGPLPFYAPGSIAGTKPGVDFGGGKKLATSPIPLTTDVTVFAVIKHRTPNQWGAIAHHGSRDMDWSLEQSGDTGNSNVLHWQTNNDNVNMELTLMQNTDHILVGRFAGTERYFSAIPIGGGAPMSVSIVDASHSITAGNKQLYLGTSDANEASNAVIGDLLYYARALTDPERDAVIDYLRATWTP